MDAVVGVSEGLRLRQIRLRCDVCALFGSEAFDAEYSPPRLLALTMTRLCPPLPLGRDIVMNRTFKDTWLCVSAETGLTFTGEQS